MRKIFCLFILSIILCPAGFAHAFEWTDNEVHLLYGTGFREPAAAKYLSREILTFQHINGYKYGKNYLFIDTIFTQAGDPDSTKLYGEGYTYLSLSKLTDMKIPDGIFKDFNLAGGINTGSESGGSKPLVYLYGISMELSLPQFAFFSIDILVNDAREPESGKGISWQITPVWAMPFKIGDINLSFVGFFDIITSKDGRTKQTILAQPQLRWDLGRHFDLKDNKLFVGIEYQYWENKYGIEGLNESFPQVMVVWKI
jgi:nucleoside-specific outer membrane channel protein Tsx